jgi:zinc/manganese transport system ATP-binding protein
MVDLIRALQKELGFTALFSAHEINPLLGAIDRVLYLGGGKAALGPVDAVITPVVLTRLYGTPIEVVHLNNRIFVLAGNTDLEAQPHLHEHHGAPAGHA